MEKDKFGNQLNKGDFIVYPRVFGRSGTVDIYVVLDFLYTEDGKFRHMLAQGFSNYSWKAARIMEKPSRLNFPDRGIKIPKEVVSKERLKMLEDKLQL